MVNGALTFKKLANSCRFFSNARLVLQQTQTDRYLLQTEKKDQERVKTGIILPKRETKRGYRQKHSAT